MPKFQVKLAPFKAQLAAKFFHLSQSSDKCRFLFFFGDLVLAFVLADSTCKFGQFIEFSSEIKIDLSGPCIGNESEFWSFGMDEDPSLDQFPCQQSPISLHNIQ